MLGSALLVLSVIAATADHISIMPLGNIEPAVIRTLAEAVSERLSVVPDVLPARATPDYSYDAARGQYSSAKILDSLAADNPGWPEGLRQHRLAVADVDLYAEGLNFVFGQADPGTGVAIISLARLREEFYGRRENPGKFMRRATKEAIHELGHTYGLGHCQNPGCVMFFSNRLADTDRKSSEFCPACRAKLPQRANRNMSLRISDCGF